MAELERRIVNRWIPWLFVLSLPLWGLSNAIANFVAQAKTSTSSTSQVREESKTEPESQNRKRGKTHTHREIASGGENGSDTAAPLDPESSEKPKRDSKPASSSTKLFTPSQLGTMSVEELLAMAQRRRTQFLADLTKFAKNCRQAGFTKLANRVDDWIEPVDSGEIRIPILPSQTQTMTLTAEEQLLSDKEQKAIRWYYTLRVRYAADLMQIARSALRKGEPTLAITLVFAAIRENPDDARLRRITGKQAYQGTWRTAWEVEQLHEGKTDHPKFGWIARSHVERYEAGQRFENRKWLSREEDAAIHSTMEHGRFIESEHYRLRTSTSLEEGVALLRQLEILHGVWSQIFIGFSRTTPEIEALFDGRGKLSGVRDRRVMQVALFADKADYVQTLQPMEPRIEESCGLYHSGTRHAYFFRGGGDDPVTIYHEATHQLFAERMRTARNDSRSGYFWMVESIACYFETLHESNGFWRLGGTDTPRLLVARLRLLEDHFYVPLRDLSSLNADQFQSQSPKLVPMLYTESAGLAQFFFHAEDGIFREAFVTTLYHVYSGTDHPDILPQAAGCTFEQLDEAYRQYIQSLGVPAGLRIQQSP